MARSCENCRSPLPSGGPGRPRKFCDDACKREAYEARAADMDAQSKAASFWGRVKVGSGCWEWQGALTHHGYGRFSPRVNGKAFRIYAHRFSLLLAGVEVPDGQDVDHLCRNRRCVNPAHLEVVSHRVNVLRGVSLSAANAQKDICDDGHEFTPENTYLRTDRRGRVCRECQRRRSAAWRARKAAQRV